jgi:hypothetical protein
MADMPHTRAFDLPGWPCPPRVGDIPKHEDSWGWIAVSRYARPIPVAQDELGLLWVNGSAVPQFRTPHDGKANPGAIVLHLEHGIGLWVHPDSMSSLPSISRFDMRHPDEWVPFNAVAAEMPTFVMGRT